MRVRMLSALAAGLTLVFATALFAQSDMMLATWKLNVAKSKYSPGPAPKSATVVLSGTDQARQLVVDATPATGAAQHWEVSGPAGQDLKITGNNPNADTYNWKRINATTVEAQYKKGGKATLKQTAVVSAAGKTLTVTATGVDGQGRETHNVVVYDK